jgi:acyl-CoA dehydrogenase
MNAPFPERYGGTGASDVDGALIGEELGWGCAAIATTLGINELAAAPVLLGGSEQIKAKYLGMLTEESKRLPSDVRCAVCARTSWDDS